VCRPADGGDAAAQSRCSSIVVGSVGVGIVTGNAAASFRQQRDNGEQRIESVGQSVSTRRQEPVLDSGGGGGVQQKQTAKHDEFKQPLSASACRQVC